MLPPGRIAGQSGGSRCDEGLGLAGPRQGREFDWWEGDVMRCMHDTGDAVGLRARRWRA